MLLLSLPVLPAPCTLPRSLSRAPQVMQERVRANDKIEVHYSTKVSDALGHETPPADGASPIRALRLEDANSGDTSEIEVAGLFYSIGNVPNTKIFGEQGVELDELRYIKTSPGSVETNVPGLYAAGDVMDKKWRQAVVAAGTGCQAALTAERYLASNGLATPVVADMDAAADDDAPAPAAAAPAGDAPEGSFGEYISGVDGVALVKFVSPTCGMCRALAPMLGRIIKKNFDPADVTVVEVDVDSQVEWAKEAKVQGTPTIQVYANGGLSTSIRGVEPRAAYLDALQGAFDAL